MQLAFEFGAKTYVCLTCLNPELGKVGHDYCHRYPSWLIVDWNGDRPIEQRCQCECWECDTRQQRKVVGLE